MESPCKTCITKAICINHYKEMLEPRSLTEAFYPGFDKRNELLKLASFCPTLKIFFQKQGINIDTKPRISLPTKKIANLQIPNPFEDI